MGLRTDFLSQFNNLPYFTKNILVAEARHLGIKTASLNSYISKGINNHELISLKRNYYVTSHFYEANKTNESYLFYLANTLLSPSYISLETALQYYSLIPEAINITTSVTLKLPRQFQNRLGLFTYRNITEKLFDGVKTAKGEFPYVIAKPYKAVFDYLYYKTKQFSRNVHPDILEELRIDIDELSEDDKSELDSLISNYTNEKIII